MTISAFSIVKNEAQFIGYGLMSILPHVDEVIYADGNSTDGTLEILAYIQERLDPEKKVKVVRGADCKDLKEDYVRLFNDLMKECKGDYLWYCHPDMVLVDPGKLDQIRAKNGLAAYSVNMRSFAGEDMELEITKGRTDKWKTIMRNNFGLHYWGYYGDDNEDMYFADITGREHRSYRNMSDYPYLIHDSGAKLWHFCECKPRKRRVEKMKNVMATLGIINPLGPTLATEIHQNDVIVNHPRVHLQSQKSMWGEFVFEPRKDPLPEVFEKYKAEFDAVLGKKLAEAV